MHRNGLAKLDAIPVCPDFSHASRRPPLVLNEKPMITTGHKSNYVLAALGDRFFTGHYILRIWDVYTGNSVNTLGDINNQSESDKVRAILPAPCLTPADEGRFVWVAKQDASIYIVDTAQPTYNKRMDLHAAPVLFLLRYRNTEVWSIDELGVLYIWNIKTMIPERYGITLKEAVAATIQGRRLWISSGRDLKVFNIASQNETHSSIKIPNELGTVTALITIPFHPDCIFSSHEYGKITRWDAHTMKKLQVITVSMYGICSMVTVGQYYVWAGYTTGMIYVYDTRPENWVVVKSWKAHHGAVLHLVGDHSGFVLNNGKAHVFSGDSTGTVGVWDGLLTDYWKERNLLKRQNEYCTYRENNIMICSWNIDANKPEKLVDEHEQIREWLKGMDDPNIIVIGIQEIIDLESKKQTARSFFAGRKKGDTPEADEGLTRRYKLWHDYLVRCVNENFGDNVYYVIKTDQLVGLFSCIFVRTKDKDRISAIDSTSVKTGLKVMNKSIHGNKGAIAIRLIYDDSSLCFINCHLAAGQSHVKQRNADVEMILHSANYPYLDNQMNIFSHGGDGTMILDHEFCFLSGDLNYRIDASRRYVIDKLIVLDQGEKEFARRELQGKDQLLRQRITNPLFKLLMFHEAPIEFDPTYKYNPGTGVYDQSEKLRVPAWCDRILYKGDTIETLYYRRYEIRASDHRPIATGLRFKTKTVDREKRRVLFQEIENDWQEYMFRFTRERKIGYITDYEQCSEEEASLLLDKVNWNVKAAVALLRK
ncbi:DNase I-like protein [Backusella circina FSU 941]|nr:DNase I-like protein [Backusella circina FSU 941]